MRWRWCKVSFEDGYLMLARGDSFYRNKLLWQPEEPGCVLTATAGVL